MTLSSSSFSSTVSTLMEECMPDAATAGGLLSWITSGSVPICLSSSLFLSSSTVSTRIVEYMPDGTADTDGGRVGMIHFGASSFTHSP